jgi:hypothetical protein
MSAARKSYLVEILLPKETGHGKPIGQKWFEDLLTELTGKFGGATSFMRAPGLGLWRSGDETERDNIRSLKSWLVSWSRNTGLACASEWSASFFRRRS